MGDSIIRDILYQEYPPLGMTDGMLTEPEVPVALATADATRKLYPARVIGPARSSEGVSVYYIVCWLDGGPG